MGIGQPQLHQQVVSPEGAAPDPYRLLNVSADVATADNAPSTVITHRDVQVPLVLGRPCLTDECLELRFSIVGSDVRAQRQIQDDWKPLLAKS